MEEYRVQIKVRNNLILEKIEEMGFKSLKEFCEKSNICYPRMVEIVNLKLMPLNTNPKTTHKFKKIIYKLCDYLGCDPEELFTETMMANEVVTNTKIVKVSESDLKNMLENDSFNELGSDDVYLQNKLPSDIDATLNTLTDRERKIIKMRFGLTPYKEEHTLDEVASEFRITSVRIRQIEMKALRKLRHPSRMKSLIPHLNNKEVEGYLGNS